MTSLAYRWFGIGKLPDTYAELAADSRTLLAAESVPMTMHAAHIRVAGRRTSKSIGRHTGALVLTPDRLVLCISRRVVIDGPYGGEAPVNEALMFAVHSGGLKVTIDIAAAIPDGTGTIVLELHPSLPANARAWLGTQMHIMALTPADVLNFTRFA